MISIIVPTYNSETCIVACLESIIGQTYGEKEIIIIDGLSSDNTIEIVRTYTARFPAIRFQSEKDNGIYDAINKGIRLAKGEWIYILGSDDRMFENTTLEKVSPLLGKMKGSVIYGNVQVMEEAGWAKDGEIYGGEFSLEQLLKRNICQQAVFYRKKIFSELGYFNPSYKVCADWDFMLRCYAAKTTCYIPEVIAKFAGGGASISLSDQTFENDFVENLYSNFGNRLKEPSFVEMIWKFKSASKRLLRKGKLMKSFSLYQIYRFHLKIRMKNS
jgi:glycosyltransferase involved in cell wall biosynthesis